MDTNIEHQIQQQKCKKCRRRSRVEGSNLCSHCLQKKEQKIEDERVQAIKQFKKWYSQRNWLVLDTESTGGGREDEIIEIGIIDSKGNIVYETLVKPSQPIPERTIEIHGITNEMVKDAPNWKKVWPEVAELIKGKMILMYASDSDVTMIRRTCKKYQLPMVSYEPRCAMKAYKKLNKLDNHVSLTRALEREQIHFIPCHRATSDCEALRKLVLTCGEKLENRES